MPLHEITPVADLCPLSLSLPRQLSCSYIHVDLYNYHTEIWRILNVMTIPLDMGRAIGLLDSSTRVNDIVLEDPSYQATSEPTML